MVGYIFVLLGLLAFSGVQYCNSRSIAHMPRSRLHKLDCKVSRQKVLASSSDEGTAVVIGADVRSDDSHWKYLSSHKLSHMWKVLAEPSPDNSPMLNAFLLKNKIANITVVQAAVIPSSDQQSDGHTISTGAVPPTVDLYCSTAPQRGDRGRGHNTSLTRPHVKRSFCSLNPNHPHFTQIHTSLKPELGAMDGETPSGSGVTDGRSMHKVTVPAMTFMRLPLTREKNNAQPTSSDSSLVRLVTIDTDGDLDYQMLMDLPFDRQEPALFRPYIVTVNYASFSQEQFEKALSLFHELKYMTCVAKKRKGHHLHAFYQPALLKIKDIQFL